MPLKLTLVSETYMPQINGVSRTLERLVEHCLQCGDHLQLLVPHYRDRVEDSAGVVRHAWRGVRLPFYREVCLPLAVTSLVRRQLRRFGPDLVHVATEGPLGLAALKACRQLGLPVVSSYHTNFPNYLASYRLGRLEPLAWRYLRWFHNATSTTLCPTPTIRDMLAEPGFARVKVWGREGGYPSVRRFPSPGSGTPRTGNWCPGGGGAASTDQVLREMVRPGPILEKKTVWCKNGPI